MLYLFENMSISGKFALNNLSRLLVRGKYLGQSKILVYPQQIFMFVSRMTPTKLAHTTDVKVTIRRTSTITLC